MSKPRSVAFHFPLLATAALGVLLGCSSSSTGRSTGSPTGSTGGGGMVGDGSIQTGGTGSGGLGANGGMSGEVGNGGSGDGGRATGGNGSGGISPSGGAAGSAAGGASGLDGGVGGNATGGSGSGGARIDAGCTGSACVVDGGNSDVSLSTCSQLTTAALCDARNDCHSVFVDPGTCGCAAAGCCAKFNRCADGGKANCAGPVACTIAQPFCEAPYVVSYSGSCYEGCVRQTVCAPPTCPQTAPAKGTACGSSAYSCFYENCATTGRTLATCTGGAWSLQTGACTTVTCTGAGVSATSLTCAAGKTCVLTTSGGGAYMITPSCGNNACGDGPVTTQCLQGLVGSCIAGTSLSGIIVNCSAPSSCGQGQGGCA